MNALRRHQLVWLDEYGWYGILASSPETPRHEAQAFECLELWAEKRWPLVVTRQGADTADAAPDAPLALGLPAPARWGRRRIAIEASSRAVLRQGEFAAATEVGAALPAAARDAWSRLCAGLEDLGLVARVYGSYGWQHLTGLDYVHARSDIDLLVPVETPRQADQACALLQHAAPQTPRVDGEIAFPDGASVAWREWVRWRSGQTRHVLVKRITGATLEDSAHWVACV